MDREEENRRELPARANRGVRNEQNENQAQQDDEFYANLFGNIDDEDEEDESFSQQLGLRPLESYSANFANYNYGRGYHYFFNLDTFPRVEGSPSYALDENRFKYTYRHDDTLIKNTPLKKLINRTHIGLPTIETTIGNTKNLDKNVCHYYLERSEDEKYYNHREISKYQYILNNLEKLIEKNKLKEYTELKKDVIMHEVYEKDVSFDRKKEVLTNRINVLKHRVENMKKNSELKDRMYYKFSQNQLFHDIAKLKGKSLEERHLKERIFNHIISLKQEIDGTEESSVTLGAEKPLKFIRNWLKLEEEKGTIISSKMENRLSSSPKMIEMFRKKEELIIFPSFLFKFGDVSRAVDSLMKAKLESDYESGFYIYKAFIKKLFKRDLDCQEEPLEEPILAQDYEEIMRQKIIAVEEFYENNEEDVKKKSKKNQFFIDDLINIVDIERTPLNEQVYLLPAEHKTEITLKELMLLYCYRNISLALESFLDYINRDPEILKFMADFGYENFHYGIARFIDSHEFCILINDIKRFTNLLMNTSLLSIHFNQILYFCLNRENNLGYVWLEVESDDWETEKDEDEIHEDNEEDEDNNVFVRNVLNDEFDPKPIKKVKENEQNQL